jgi:hypothetical protein
MKKPRLQYASDFRKEKDFFKKGIQKLVERWQKGIEVGGYHVEK